MSSIAGSRVHHAWLDGALHRLDGGASVVLVAVVREFDSKADKSNANPDGQAAVRDAVIELEQAGDSAKAAAEADPGVGEAAKQAVLDAHLAICVLKTKL